MGTDDKTKSILSSHFPYVWNSDYMQYLGTVLTVPFLAANLLKPLISWAGHIAITKMMTFPIIVYHFHTVTIFLPSFFLPMFQKILLSFIWGNIP